MKRMSQTSIERLTPDQEALIPVYREKWIKIATSTASLDRSQAIEAVTAAYELIGKEEPDIIFADSPASAWRHILLNLSPSITEYKNLLQKFNFAILIGLQRQISSQIAPNLFTEIETREIIAIGGLIEIAAAILKQIGMGIDKFGSLGTENWVYYGSFLDYCISGLHCQAEGKIWLIYQRLLHDAGWIFPFEKICIVCDRPRILSLDDRQRLHAEGAPAIQYADGLSVYAYQGVLLPEKYGKLHPHQWRSQWILEEENAELRRVLIQGIG